MSASKKSCKSEQPSIKYRWIPAEGAFECSEFVPKESVLSLSDKNKKSRVKSEAKPPEILSTAELISSLNQIWNCASNITIFKRHSHPDRNHHDFWKDNLLANLGREENCMGSISADSKYFCFDLRTAKQLSPVTKQSFKFVQINKKVVLFDSCEKTLNHSFYNGLPCYGTDSWRRKGLSTLGFSYELENVYKFIRETIPAGQLYVNCLETDNKETGKYSLADSISSDLGGCISTERTDSLPIENPEFDFHSYKFKDSSTLHDAKESTTLCSDYFLTDVQENKANCSISRTEDSNICADCYINFLPSNNSTYKECHHHGDGDEQLRDERKQDVVSTENEIRMGSHSTACEKHQIALAKQEHAFAGAFAGIFVSLCLHPIDTVKTVIQSCHAEKSIFYIGRSIISERGLIGLYRGIASNIAASAPISALYTFSYESVKGALLPLFPKEYHSLTHCISGGCASIATSFIFTPSERIKQQMQVGVHYQNCWNALIGIIKKGGLPSLYTGWGAVLCRNVPHSIIKFYTYESLKQVMSTSLQSSSQLNTLQTLVCGGLAGSTAALFTTPFDVVKTRLQTQIPGSLSKYSSVCHALQDISMSEGLKGLYRGLIPRLVMYMSQGALFFASYEFLKQLFSLEVQQLTTQKQLKEKKDYSSS